MDSIVVLMSTYNGDKYIDEQIASILNQKEVNVHLYIRDDGSTDDTVYILTKYKNMYPRKIDLELGDNKGVKNSFAWLILNAPNSQYYAFADQDDIWDADKLYIAISMIKKKEKETVLYFCNQRCVDENNKNEFIRLSKNNLQPYFMNTIFFNRYSGCTMVFDNNLIKKMRKVLSSYEGNVRVMHDIVCLVIAQLTGNTIYDSTAHMSFRRHEANVTEAVEYNNMGLYKKINIIKRKINTLAKYKKICGIETEFLCKVLACLKENITEEDEKKIQYFINYKQNLKNWTNFLLKNTLKEYFSSPKYVIYLKILLRIY